MKAKNNKLINVAICVDALQTILIILRLLSVINWSWWIIFLPYIVFFTYLFQTFDDKKNSK